MMIRIAAAEPQDQGLDAGTILQRGAMGVAAVAPFGGLIGRDKLLHDPLQGAKGKNFKSLEELGRHARPTDMLITSKPTGSYVKKVLDPIGDTQFYHAQPVIGRDPSTGLAHTYQAGDMFGMDLGDEAANMYTANVADYLKDQHINYTDAVLLRRKTPLTRAQEAKYLADLDERATRFYDTEHGQKSLLKDIFLPKIKRNIKPAAEVLCEGNVCSTMPAMSAATVIPGERVLDAVPASETMPHMYMRSPHWELVGSHVTPETRAIQNSLLHKVGPYAARAGIGAALAGGTYALTEEPELGAGIAATMGTLKMHEALREGNVLRNTLPRSIAKPLGKAQALIGNGELVGALNAVQDEPTLRRKLLGIGAELKGRIPMALGAGALAYAGAKEWTKRRRQA